MMAFPLESQNPSPDIYIPHHWSDAANSIASAPSAAQPPITFICGAKNSGKSTFSRHLLTVLLQRYRRVAYLDTDVGQPEFTPPGLLSITTVHEITPDLAIPCLKTPDRSFFFGDISSKRDPSTYLNYIFALVDYYHKEYLRYNQSEKSDVIEVPLVVNSPGWVKGIGYEILVDILRYVAPTHVVKINISVKNKNLPSGDFWLGGDYNAVTNVIEINSAHQDSFNRSILVQKDAHHHRDLRLMSYFRQCFPTNLHMSTIKELARALASHPPYEVPIESIKIRHLHCEVPDSELFYSLNATIVGLAVSSEELDRFPSCVGLGIVRGVDLLKGLVYVITPVPQNVLVNVDLILQGFIQIPTCLLQVKGCRSPYVSANVLPMI